MIYMIYIWYICAHAYEASELSHWCPFPLCHYGRAAAGRNKHLCATLQLLMNLAIFKLKKQKHKKKDTVLESLTQCRSIPTPTLRDVVITSFKLQVPKKSIWSGVHSPPIFFFFFLILSFISTNTKIAQTSPCLCYKSNITCITLNLAPGP